MSLLVPNASLVTALQAILTPALTLRLFGNNVIPAVGDTAASYTEIAGGGYVAKVIVFANWIFTSAVTSIAEYPIQTWIFTGAVNAPGTVYGYFITRNSDGLLIYAERFAAAVLPFAPLAGSVVNVTPRFTGKSV